MSRPSTPSTCFVTPYPFFAQKRREAGVFKGSVMDWSKTPDSMMPEQLYAAVSFDACSRSTPTRFRQSVGCSITPRPYCKNYSYVADFTGGE
jgi:hypothetical protein